MSKPIDGTYRRRLSSADPDAVHMEAYHHVARLGRRTSCGAPIRGRYVIADPDLVTCRGCLGQLELIAEIRAESAEMERP